MSISSQSASFSSLQGPWLPFQFEVLTCVIPGFSANEKIAQAEAFCARGGVRLKP